MAIRGVLDNMTAFSIVISQLSLVALWAAISRVHFAVRFSVVLCTVVVCWIIRTQIVGYSAKGPLGANWATAFFVQVATVYFLATNYLAILKCKSMGQSTRDAFKIDLQSMFVWTTCAAIVFALYQFARTKLEWTGILDSWSSMVPVVGLIFALAAAICAWPFTTPNSNLSNRDRVKRFALAGAGLFVLVILNMFVLRRLIDDYAAREARMVVIGQAVAITASLIMTVPRVFGRNHPVSGQHGT